MSMPQFPEMNPEITCENTLNMILTSIALEELALSHIINAEGEMLQYILGTLKTNNCIEPDIEDALKVNQSINEILESVSQNQMLLKNKMSGVLHALSDICPKQPEPPCKCLCKCSASFKAGEKFLLWRGGSALKWEPEHIFGDGISLNPCDAAMIELCSEGRFAINFSINIKVKYCKCNAAVSLVSMKGECCPNIHNVYSLIPYENETVTVSMSGIIIENYEIPSILLLKLDSPDSLIIESATLSITEI